MTSAEGAPNAPYSVSLSFDCRYTRWMREANLPGVNTTGATLIGDVVHKKASPVSMALPGRSVSTIRAAR